MLKLHELALTKGLIQVFGAAKRTPIPPLVSLSRNWMPARWKADWIRTNVDT